MKLLADLMIKRPNGEQREAYELVLDVARRWKAGEFPIAGARSACTGYDRWIAVRVAKHKSPEKKLLMRMLDALVDAQADMIQTDHGLMDRDDLHRYGARAMTNWEGKRVYVFPMAYIGNEPKYPPVHLAPGDERTEKEAAIRAAARKG